MGKYYFRTDDEYCYNIKDHLDYMQENGIKEMDVFEAKRQNKVDYFFCKHYSEFGESGECCGKKWCASYEPNNGKNGRCKHYGYTYKQTEIKKTLKC